MLQIINANYFFTAAFTIEVLLQSIAKNFILGPNGKPGHCLPIMLSLTLPAIRSSVSLRVMCEVPLVQTPAWLFMLQIGWWYWRAAHQWSHASARVAVLHELIVCFAACTACRSQSLAG